MNSVSEQTTDEVIGATTATMGEPGNIARPVGALYGIFILMAGGFFYAMEALVIRRFRVAFTNAMFVARNKAVSMKSKMGSFVFWACFVMLVSMLGFGYKVMAEEIQYESKTGFYCVDGLGVSCDSTSHSFGNIAVAHEIDLLPFLQQALNSASNNHVYPVIDMISGTVEHKKINSFKRPTKYDEVGFIIRRIENKIHVIPSSVGSDVNIKVDYTGKRFTEQYSTWLSIAPKSAGDLKANVPSPVSKGLCDSFARNSSIDQNAINVAMRNMPDTCDLSGLNEAYLSWYVLERNDS